jgi:hypothetical protein
MTAKIFSRKKEILKDFFKFQLEGSEDRKSVV